ncbi:uncharacterized protein LOC143276507 isoform X2 [Babylonia areolata]|uniref:uncharacterized protein LOC143276507 isoform X2 n=1 Tax=Babylonia areolata TaxID=304850 RepID=UPI003FD41927
MVVADEDPPRKRSRLSLKSKKEDSTPLAEDSEPPPLKSDATVPQGLPINEEEVTDCSPPVIDLTESDLPSDGPVVPPVASMENLGNTCFLNSVLEVLRYTPCFLEGLEELYRHIVYLEKIKSSDVVQSSEEVKTDPVLAWDLVKNMFKMYKKMERREEMFSEFASADVTSMAVKPDKVLDVIREFNPMFEGNMQHDAQEVLRCLLCYLEDSERQLHSDYAVILAVQPSLLKNPGPHTASLHDPHQRPGCHSVMEKFLAAGKARLRRGKSAVAALNFDQSQPGAGTKPSESRDSASWLECSGSVHLKRSSHTAGQPTAQETLVGGCKEEKNSEPVPDVKKRKFRHTRLRKVAKTEEEFDEVDGMSKKPQSTGCPDVGPSVAGQNPGSPKTYVRRSVRQRVTSKRLVDYIAQQDCAKEKRACTLPKAETSKDVSDSKSTEKKSTDCAMMNGDHSEKLDKSQPTILSMLSRKGGQCRRLGMRGRVVHTQHGSINNPTPMSFPVSPESPPTNQSPEPRRSPRKPGTVLRPNAAVSMSPQQQKQIGVMTPSSSPARPDEFPTVSPREGDVEQGGVVEEGGAGRGHKAPICAQVWPVEGLGSPHDTFHVGGASSQASSSSSGIPPSHTQIEDADSMDGDAPQVASPDRVVPPSTTVEDGFDGLRLSKGVSSPVKSRLEKMLASKQSGGLTSPVSRGSSVSPSMLGNPQPQQPPSKLMIKLEKCDHLCNTPTISASAALKALKGTAATCRRMNFSDNDVEEVNKNNEQDSDEDEVSLGTKSSFTSVPLKSVCVKVEKCDTVCDSPEKSVSARFAASRLARQRAQRFNIMEKLFQGTMVMRTKCMECERRSERKESFQDVSVPLAARDGPGSDSESGSDEERDSSLLRLMRAFTDVERLRDDNKYFCEPCCRYVEAERSLHYEALPNILTVHLKRFSATGMFGCLSKINDYVTVPLLLSCLRYKCPKPCVRPDHRYTLYAIITHAGSTISAGHYLSYIKVRPNAVGNDTLSTYLHNTPAKKLHNGHDSHNIFDSPLSPQRATESPIDTGLKQKESLSSLSSSLRKAQPHSVTEKGDWDLGSDPGEDPSSHTPTPRMAPVGGGGGGEGGVNGSHPADYHWLECDDETIRILSEKDFHGRLMETEGALRGTPYVLFYHRLDTWNAK